MHQQLKFMIEAKQTGMIASQFSFQVSSQFEINDRKLEQQVLFY